MKTLKLTNASNLSYEGLYYFLGEMISNFPLSAVRAILH